MADSEQRWRSNALTSDLGDDVGDSSCGDGYDADAAAASHLLRIPGHRVSHLPTRQARPGRAPRRSSTVHGNGKSNRPMVSDRARPHATLPNLLPRVRGTKRVDLPAEAFDRGMRVGHDHAKHTNSTKDRNAPGLRC